MANQPIYTPPAYCTGVSNTGRNVITHLLRNKEYDLQWLLWAVQQKYLDRNTLKAIQNRLNEITNG